MLDKIFAALVCGIALGFVGAVVTDIAIEAFYDWTQTKRKRKEEKDEQNH